MNVAMLLDIPASIVPEDLVLISGDHEWTYEDLRGAVSRMAALLAARGVTPGDRVGVFATNESAYVAAMFAAAAVGAAVVPMNFRARTDETRHLLADSGSKVVFTQTRYRQLVEQQRPETLGSIEMLGVPKGADADEAIADVDDDDLAFLLYTSGTTALPKGVALSHGALTNYVLESTECADGTPRGRTLIAAPLYHVAGITSMLTSVYSGRAVVLLPQFDEAAWLDAVQRHRVTHAFVVPTMLSRVVDHAAFLEFDLSSLELVTYGAAPMPLPVIRRALKRFPDTVSFSQAYGLTETTATVTVLDADDHRLDGTERKTRRLASVGRAVDGVELRIVDESGRMLPPNEPGEVQLRTRRTMQRYWGHEEKTRVTVDEEHWVHTGDLGYLDEDGYLFLTGRAGDMIIRGGENIAPEEVETVLYEHPDVAEAATVGLPDEEWGERVVSAVVLRPGATVTPVELIEFCKKHLASFKRPERIVFVKELPHTSTGKLLRRELKPLL